MGVNSLPKNVTRQRHVCDLNPGPSASESSTLTTRLPSHPFRLVIRYFGEAVQRPFACYARGQLLPSAPVSYATGVGR